MSPSKEAGVKYEAILVDKEAGIATVTLNRPEVLNAFNDAMGREFMEAMESLAGDKAVRVVVLKGAGRGFSAGADVRRFAQAVEARSKGEKVIGMGSVLRGRGPLALREMPQPVIASVHGPCVGLGFTLALASDLRIAAQDVQFGAVFARVGLMPEFGSTYFLPRLVGVAKALELCLTGRLFGAQEALEIGLVNRVVPGESLEAETYELARQIAAGPPLALGLIKRFLHQGLDADLPTQYYAESLAIQRLFESEDHAEGVRAFLEKRAAVFKGR
ncbi:MAG: enoyl-CoA hydratase [Chloroflexi bacterium]|nr:enoyl-CoA hydratase [Chloroflexota bacterium]